MTKKNCGIASIVAILSVILFTLSIAIGKSIVQEPVKIISNAQTSGSSNHYEVNISDIVSARGRQSATKFIIRGNLCYKESPPAGSRYKINVYKSGRSAGRPEGTKMGIITTPSRVICGSGSNRRLKFQILLRRLSTGCPPLTIVVSTQGRNSSLSTPEVVISQLSIPSQFCGQASLPTNQVSRPVPTNRLIILPTSEVTFKPVPSAALITSIIENPFYTPKPSDVPSVTPILTPAGCFERCNANQSCQSGLECFYVPYAGRVCANPNNPTDPSCSNATPSVTKPRELCDPKDISILGKLRCGNLVILLRHTATNGSQNELESKMINELTSILDSNNGNVSDERVVRLLNDCNQQRLLSGDGRRQASAIGTDIRKLQIPIGKVFTSPWCRTKDTGTLAFGRAISSPDKLFEQIGPASTNFNKRYTSKLRSLLRTNTGNNKNTVIITHSGPISRVLNRRSTPGEGNAYIFEKGRQIYGPISAEGWSQLEAKPTSSDRTAYSSFNTYLEVSNNSLSKTVSSVEMSVCVNATDCSKHTININIEPQSKKLSNTILDNVAEYETQEMSCKIKFTDGTYSNCTKTTEILEADRAVRLDINIQSNNKVLTIVKTTTTSIDVNNDCIVNTIDYSLVLKSYGKCSTNGLNSDNTFDGCVNALDLSKVYSNLGRKVCN